MQTVLAQDSKRGISMFCILRYKSVCVGDIFEQRPSSPACGAAMSDVCAVCSTVL